VISGSAASPDKTCRNSTERIVVAVQLPMVKMLKKEWDNFVDTPKKFD
jgi:hypothetical protein